MATTPQKYDESSVKILKGLDPVKLRPGQFTRVDDPLHIVQEVIDNAVDEAIGGFATEISVELCPDGGIRVADNGRGIPVGVHPEEGIPVIQAIFTVLYSGGKFDKAAGGAYGYAGGLHGVGVSVTNALSSSLIAEVQRDGATWRIAFADGEVVEPLRKLGKSDGHGTAITVRPNPKYFSSPELPFDPLLALLKSKAVLLPGLIVNVQDMRKEGEPPKSFTFSYTNGLSGYLAELAGVNSVVPTLSGEGYSQSSEEATSSGEGAAWAFSWFESGDGGGQSFVNLIPTPEGGTHVAGLRSALFSAIRTYVEHHTLLPRGLKLSADDVFRHVRYVLSARLMDPSFDNQTKDRLNSRDAVKTIERAVLPFVEAWMNHNPVEAKAVSELVIRSALARARSSQKIERKRSSSVVMLPGKLADCESSDPALTELFLVEGDSAGGSAKQSRSKEFQAILALRGKGLNVWERTAEEAMANVEIHDISVAIGIQPHKAGAELDFSKLRYGKICLLADADVDGYHIQCLLLTLFFKHFPMLIEKGHVFIAQPPLYRIDVDAVGKKKQAKKLYAMDGAELRGWEDRLRKEGYSSWQVGRFKGLGEMDPPELWETTLNPDTRRLLRVSLPKDQTQAAIEAFENLMGKSKAGWRKEWMERRGDEVSAE
jgi:topoisomerase-4 subunit B